MFNQILDFFENQKWKYFCPDKDKNVAMLGISTSNGKFHCFLDVDEDDNKLIFFSIYPINVPQSLRRDAATLLLTINYRIYMGSFMINFDDGEIRFKTSLVYPDTVISNQMLEYNIKGNISTMSNYFEDINDFISAKISLEEALKKIKNQIQQ